MHGRSFELFVGFLRGVGHSRVGRRDGPIVSAHNDRMVRERGFERLVNFSDAVVAIAATLLVLPLADSDAPRSGSTVPELLVEHRAELLAFALSFAVICNLWWVHHEVYRDLVGYTTPVVVANCVWLASIVFLPFPTQLISSGDSDHPGSASLYIGVIAVASGAMMATRFLVARNPGTPPRRRPW